MNGPRHKEHGLPYSGHMTTWERLDGTDDEGLPLMATVFVCDDCGATLPTDHFE